MSWVYVLRSLKDNRLYVGSTRQSVEERVSRHNSGQVSSTRNRKPLVLLYTEHYDDYSDARKKEIYFKTGSGRECLSRILTNRAGTQVAKGDRL